MVWKRIRKLNLSDILEEQTSSEKGRHILAIDRWIFPVGELTSSKSGGSDDEAMDVESTAFWIHFRASSIALFDCPQIISFDPTAADKSPESITLPKFHHMRDVASTSYYGFCGALNDSQRNRLIVPDMEVSIMVCF